MQATPSLSSHDAVPKQAAMRQSCRSIGDSRKGGLKAGDGLRCCARLLFVRQRCCVKQLQKARRAAGALKHPSQHPLRLMPVVGVSAANLNANTIYNYFLFNLGGCASGRRSPTDPSFCCTTVPVERTPTGPSGWSALALRATGCARPPGGVLVAAALGAALMACVVVLLACVCVRACMRACFVMHCSIVINHNFMCDGT